MLLSLPTETIIHALDLADFRSILSCGATCKRLRSITTTAEPLLYITTLAANGLREVGEEQYESLSVSEKLARVREYERVGSRGGQLVLYDRISKLPSRRSYGYWITQTRADDGSLTISRVKVGGPRNGDLSPRELLLASIPGPRPTRCAVCYYDPDTVIGITYEPEPYSLSLTGRLIWTFNVWDLSSVNATILSSFRGNPMLPRSWSAYGYTISYRSGGKRITRDLRFTEPIQTLEIPYIAEPTRNGHSSHHVLVADDMSIIARNPIAETPRLETDPSNFPLAPSYEVHLLNNDQPTTVFTLRLPRLNDEWNDATVERSGREPVVDGVFGRMDGVAATYQDHRLFYDHWRFRCPITLNLDRSVIEYTEDNILVCLHVPRLREFLRRRARSSETQSRFLEWDEWAAHARIVVLRALPVPYSIHWRSSENTTGMRIALWRKCLNEEVLNSPELVSAARMIAILDFHPSRARRRDSDADADLRFALDDGLHGSGMVRPFQDENAYAGGLACAEYTYKLPPDVSTQGGIYKVYATTLDGVVLTQRSHAGKMVYVHCALPNLQNAENQGTPTDGTV
ncbi:unnamed protein product [Peniophora sp. CBMAI 1063]|nr:unnamed protein product [Peniophora sp. CBMAI 1063]